MGAKKSTEIRAPYPPIIVFFCAPIFLKGDLEKNRPFFLSSSFFLQFFGEYGRFSVFLFTPIKRLFFIFLSSPIFLISKNWRFFERPFSYFFPPFLHSLLEAQNQLSEPKIDSQRPKINSQDQTRIPEATYAKIRQLKT